MECIFKYTWRVGCGVKQERGAGKDEPGFPLACGIEYCPFTETGKTMDSQYVREVNA